MANPKQSINTEKKERKFNVYYIAIFVLSFVFYGNSLKNEYSMDDNLVTSTFEGKHPLVEGGIAAIPQIFTSHYAVNSKQSYAYRPVTTSSFAIEYQFFGQNPAASHFLNVLLYALTIFVLFRVLNQMWGEEKFILTVITCLLFLIHPLHTEVVDNIKSRDEILSLLFGLLSMKHAFNYFDKSKIIYLLFSILLLALSLLSKKTGMIFIAIIPLSMYYFRGINAKKMAILFSSVLVGFVVFKLFGKTLLEEEVSRKMFFFENPLYYAGFSERIPMFFYSNYYYLGLLILPYPLRYYYGYDQVPIADWSNPIVYIMLIFMVTTVGLTFWRIRKKEIWGYGLLFYFLAIGGACNLLFPAVGIIAERFAFIASVGFSITVSYGIYHLFFEQKAKYIQLQKFANGSIVILSLICLVYVFNRNKAWNNDFSLYKHDIQYLDKSYKANNLLGQGYYKEGLALKNTNQPAVVYMPKIDTAEMYFKKCLSIYSEYAVTYNNIGALNFVFKNEQDTAYRYFSLALALDSNYTEALFNLGNIESNRFYGYYFLYKFTSNKQDSINPVTSYEEVDLYNDQLLTIGRLLQGMNSKFPVIINAAGNQSTNQQEFLTNLQNNVLSYLKSVDALKWIDQNEFKQIFLTNGKGIVSSYENGYLNEHLLNFVGTSITSKILNNGGIGKLNTTSIANWSKQKQKYYQELFLLHMKKCISLTPSYYPAFQSLNQYFYDMKEYDSYISLNKKIANSEAYPYQYEFYNNLAKGYYFEEKLDSALYYLNSTIQELDRCMTEVPEKASELIKFKQGVTNQINHVNQMINNTSN